MTFLVLDPTPQFREVFVDLFQLKNIGFSGAKNLAQPLLQARQIVDRLRFLANDFHATSSAAFAANAFSKTEAQEKFLFNPWVVPRAPVFCTAASSARARFAYSG